MDIINNHNRISTKFFNILRQAEKKIYITLPCLDFNSRIEITINKNSYDISFLEFIRNICEIRPNLEIQIMVTNEGLKNHPNLPTNCHVTIIKNFGPTIKNELLPWTNTVSTLFTKIANERQDRDEYVLKLKDLEIFGNNNIYNLNQSYILVDSHTIIFGDFYRILFNCASSSNKNKNSWLVFANATSNFIKFCEYNLQMKGKISENIWKNEFDLFNPADLKNIINDNKNDTNMNTKMNKLMINSYSYSSNVSKGFDLPSPDSNKSILNNEDHHVIINDDGTEEKIFKSVQLPLSSPIDQNDKIEIKSETGNRDNGIYDIIGSPGLEHDLMCHLIENSQNYIYIESSTFLSGSQLQTQNQIAKYLCDRLIKKGTNRIANNTTIKDEFKCLIVVNHYGHIQNTLFEDAQYINEKIKLTLEYIMKEISDQGYDPIDFKDDIFICSNPDQEISFSVFIQDGKNCLLSSSSICDRSLDKKNIELALYFRNSLQILHLQKILWQKYNFNYNSNEFNLFFTHLRSNANDRVISKRSWYNLNVKKKFKKSNIILKCLIGDIYYC